MAETSGADCLSLWLALMLMCISMLILLTAVDDGFWLPVQISTENKHGGTQIDIMSKYYIDSNGVTSQLKIAYSFYWIWL